VCVRVCVCVIAIYEQVKRLICDRLATYLRVLKTNRNNYTVEISHIDAAVGNLYPRNNFLSNGVWHCLPRKRSASLSADDDLESAATRASTRRSISSAGLLMRICDLLETRNLADARRQQLRNSSQELMSNWVVAAAAVDRVFFICIILCCVAGILALVFKGVMNANASVEY